MQDTQGHIIYIGECEARLLSLLQSQWSYRVSCLGEAWPVREENNVQLCIIDVPVERIARTIASMRRYYPAVMVLALVGFADTHAEAASIAGGADEILHKPLTTTRLQLSLHNLMKIHALQREVQLLRQAAGV